MRQPLATCTQRLVVAASGCDYVSGCIAIRFWLYRYAGVLNSAENDEFVYHESLVQPAMCAHPNPKTVFIGGGGEGATLREVLRHPSVERAVMVDIDGELCEVFKTELPQYPAGAYDDPRTTLVYDDCKRYLEDYQGPPFDVVILDLADPVEAGPAFPIWTKEYYKTCTDKMSQDGILVTQAGPFSVNQVSEICTPVAKTLGVIFPSVLTYGAHIPSFGHAWAYNIAFKMPSALDTQSPEEVDASIASHLGVQEASKLGWYDGLTHRSMFSLPRPIRVALAAETRVVSMDTPLAFMAGEGVRELAKI